MICAICKREAIVFYKDEAKLNGRSETFYSNKDGKIVCIECLGFTPKTLQELNKERSNKTTKV